MIYLIYTLLGFVGIFLLATQPFTVILQVLTKPVPDKGKIALQFLWVWVKSLFMLPATLMAPVFVIPMLWFTKWQDEHLPDACRFFDNDASINGDVRTDDPTDGKGGWELKTVPYEEDNQSAIDMCYWAKGHHPRSFYARWVWIGLRNRCSMGAIMLGKKISDYETKTYGDLLTENGHSGHLLTVVDSTYRYYSITKLGPFCIRTNYGYKNAQKNVYGPAIPFVAIAFSLKKWKEV